MGAPKGNLPKLCLVSRLKPPKTTRIGVRQVLQILCLALHVVLIEENTDQGAQTPPGRFFHIATNQPGCYKTGYHYHSVLEPTYLSFKNKHSLMITSNYSLCLSIKSSKSTAQNNKCKQNNKSKQQVQCQSPWWSSIYSVWCICCNPGYMPGLWSLSSGWLLRDQSSKAMVSP